MFKIHKEEIELAGKKLTLETGKIARQADGAIIATLGETVVISTVVGKKQVNPDTDYYVDIVLEEINISWNFSIFKKYCLKGTARKKNRNIYGRYYSLVSPEGNKT